MSGNRFTNILLILQNPGESAKFSFEWANDTWITLAEINILLFSQTGIFLLSPHSEISLWKWRSGIFHTILSERLCTRTPYLT